MSVSISANRRSARDADAHRCRGVCGPGNTLAASKARRTRSAAMPASARVLGNSAMNSSPPSRPMTSLARKVFFTTDANRWSVASPVWWPMRVVDRLEVIEVERQHADRLLGQPAATHHLGASLEEAASIEQFRQRIGCGRQFVLPHGAVFRQDQHDESCADNIKHDFDRIDCDPTGAETEHAAAGLR